MSDTSQGPGWWVASDGKWYPPQPVVDAPPPPPPAATVPSVLEIAAPPPATATDSPGPGWWVASDGSWYPPQPVQREKKKHTGRNLALLGGGVAVVAVAIAVAAVASKKNAPAAVSTAPAAASVAAAAADSYVTAFNTMNDADNAGLAKQNTLDSDPVAATAGINDRISARQEFDATVRSIVFPASAKSDAGQVLSADAALETLLATLSANTDNTYNYNQVFNTVTPGEAAFVAADSTLSNDLGLNDNP